MSTIIAYLHFSGTCREAMTFYQQCLGGDLTMWPFADMPNPEQLPAAARARIMHATLTHGPLTLRASDNPHGPVTPGDSASLSLECASVAEAEQLFAALAEGGTVKMPLADQFWGARFGMLTDRFDTNWMVSYDYPQAA